MLILLLRLLKFGCRHVVLLPPLPGGVAEGEHELGRPGFEGERPVVLGGGFRNLPPGLFLRLGVGRHLGFGCGEFLRHLRDAFPQKTFAFHELLMAQHRVTGIDHHPGQAFHLLLGLVEVVFGQPPTLMGGLAVAPVP